MFFTRNQEHQIIHSESLPLAQQTHTTTVNGEYQLCFAQDAIALRASAPFSHKLTVKQMDILHIADANQ